METHSFDSPQPVKARQNGSKSPTPVLYPWDVGPAVALMQELLRAHGFALRIDGDFGWRTEVAVKTFQRQQHLRVDGVVGIETWQTLMATVKPGARPLHRGCSGADVNELQGLLQVNGYGVRRSGNFDAETRSAVITFQREHHLRDDGIVDAVTWSLLQGKNKTSSPPKKATLFHRHRKKRSN